MGLALVENGELVRFGIKTFKGRKNLEQFPLLFARYVQALIRRHRPSVLVVEEVFYPQAKLSTLLKKLVVEIKIVARQMRLSFKGYSPIEVKRALCTGKPTRANLAESVSCRFPFLVPYCRRRTRTRYWQQMFDAVGLAMFESAHHESMHRTREPSKTELDTSQ